MECKAALNSSRATLRIRSGDLGFFNEDRRLGPRCATLFDILQ